MNIVSGRPMTYSVMQSMIKQRNESIAIYEQAGREELAAKEKSEIEVFERLLPRQLNEEETGAAIKEIIAQTGAASMKDLGKVMSALREKYAGQMDFGKASGQIKALLS